MIIRDAVRNWLNYKSPDWCPEQKERVGYIVKHWLQRWGNKDVAALTPMDVEELERARIGAGRKAATLNAEKIQLNGFLKYTCRHGWRKGNPAEAWRTRPREIDEGYYCVLTPEEESKLLTVAPPEWKRLILGALGMGHRASTLRRLQWEWFSRAEDGWYLTVPKTAMKMHRELVAPVSDRVMEVIGPPGSGPVFPGMPQRVQLAHQFKALVRRAGINPRLKFHDLRATFATRLLDRGVPLTTVMRLGGWRKMDVVLERYMRRLEARTGRDAINQI